MASFYDELEAEIKTCLCQDFTNEAVENTAKRVSKFFERKLTQKLKENEVNHRNAVGAFSRGLAIGRDHAINEILEKIKCRQK